MNVSTSDISGTKVGLPGSGVGTVVGEAEGDALGSSVGETDGSADGVALGSTDISLVSAPTGAIGSFIPFFSSCCAKNILEK